MTPAEIADLITREFPGWSAQRHDMRVILWRGDGPMPDTDGDTDRYAAVDPEPPIMADILTAAEYATGEVALSRRDNPPEPRKDFTTKPRLDLIPPGVLSGHVLPVLHDGAQKHGRDHWRGCTRREYALAAATHVLAYLDGEETDESGHAALAHAAADLLLGLGVES